jgi:hypothetical protein
MVLENENGILLNEDFRHRPCRQQDLLDDQASFSPVPCSIRPNE